MKLLESEKREILKLIEADKPHVKKGTIAIELTDFSVYYSQDTVSNAAEALKEGKNKIVVEHGKIIKVMKDKDGIITKEILTKKWTDWIDYWAVDFNFESKREIVRVPKEIGAHAQTALPGMGDNQLHLQDWKRCGLATLFSKMNGRVSGQKATGQSN